MVSSCARKFPVLDITSGMIYSNSISSNIQIDGIILN